MGLMAEHYEYKVLELREKMIGGKMSGDKLEKILNENAAQGWRLKAITSADVKGRLGPGGVEGLLLTLERVVAFRGKFGPRRSAWRHRSHSGRPFFRVIHGIGRTGGVLGQVGESTPA